MYEETYTIEEMVERIWHSRNGRSCSQPISVYESVRIRKAVCVGVSLPYSREDRMAAGWLDEL